MKTLIGNAILIACSLFSIEIHSQPAVAWADNITGQGYDETFDVALDTAGNVFICGQVEFTSYFSGYPLSTAGIHDIYLAKYNKAGTLLWAKREGGTGGDKAYSVGVDRAGNAYIVGEYEEDFIFGTTHVTADAGNNMFVAKYDPSGNFQWVKTMQGGGETVRGYAAAVDADGNVYAGGVIHGDLEYNGSRLYSTRGHSDVYFAKFTTTGHFVWAKRIGDVNDDEIWGLAVHDDKLYVTGSFVTKTKFASTTVNSSGDADFYLAQYDTSGQFIWAKHGGGGGFDEGRDVTVNKYGEIICTGDFQGTAGFSGRNLVSNGNKDIFVVSYDDNGSLLWGNKFGGTGFDGGSGIVNDPAGNLYVTGDYEGVAVFDSLHTASVGGIDIFVAQLDSDGNAEYVKSFGGPGNERGRSCAVDKMENVFVNGEYWDSIYLDTNELTGQLLIDAFLTRVGNDPVCTDLSVTNAIVADESCVGCNDGSISLTVQGGAAPYYFSWSDGDHNENRSGLATGTYYMFMSDSNNCNLSDTFFVGNAMIGIADVDQSPDISLFNDVTHAHLYISAKRTMDGMYVLSSPTGQIISEGRLNSLNTDIDLSAFSTGVYMLLIENEKAQWSKKIIKL